MKTNYTENKYRYNSGSELQNKEFSDGSGWEMYETQYRGYDAQIGRFGQIDPLTEFSAGTSEYAFVEDNPVIFVDPLGLKESYNGPKTKSSGGVGHYENGHYVCSSCGPDDGSNDEGSTNDGINAATWNYLLDTFGGNSFGDGDEGGGGNFGTGGGGGGNNSNNTPLLFTSLNVFNGLPPISAAMGPGPLTPLTDWEVEQFEKVTKWSHNDKQFGSRHDLKKDKDGNIYEQDKQGIGEAQPTGFKIKNGIVTPTNMVATQVIKPIRDNLIPPKFYDPRRFPAQHPNISVPFLIPDVNPPVAPEFEPLWPEFNPDPIFLF